MTRLIVIFAILSFSLIGFFFGLFSTFRHQSEVPAEEQEPVTPPYIPEDGIPPSGEVPVTDSPKVAKRTVEVPPLQEMLPSLPLPPVPSVADDGDTALPATTAPLTFALPPEILQLPPLDEEALLKAVVKIQCLAEDGVGKYIGSGFVIKENAVITAAHLVMDSGSETCEVIFPRERRPVYYLRATIRDFSKVRQRHDEKGIDVAVLDLPPLDLYPEARAIFLEYPTVPYSICGDPDILGDSLLHFGYPSNYADQNYLSRLEGRAMGLADIGGIKEQLSADGTYTFKSPVFSFTTDESVMHPYMVSRVPSFYGDSGGLAFNASKRCVIGPHRGGTIGGGAGENYSVFMNVGWEGARQFLPAQ